MNTDLKERIITFFQACDSFKGMNVKIQEYISTNKNNFNRHFTTFSQLEFQIQDFEVRFSGARASFRGEKQLYEIGADMIIEFTQKDHYEFEFVEKYSEKVYRKSILKFE